MSINFNSPTLNLLVDRGRIEDDNSRKFLRNALGLSGKKVEATRHTILSGPPGVGKTYGTMDECVKANLKYITISEGSTDIQIVSQLAYAVYHLKSNEELIVILDDADNAMFGSYEGLNRWKIATAEANPMLGIVPYYTHAVNMTNTYISLEKQGQSVMVEALKAFAMSGGLGVQIDMSRVRVIVLCNLDLENSKSFNSVKIRSAVPPMMDRFEYRRMQLSWEYQWGWLAYVLGNTQPFDNYPLCDDQKKELLSWMYSNWDRLRNTSYRTVRKLAASMINDPASYIDEWNGLLKAK